MPSASSRQRMDDLTADDEKAEEGEAQIPLEELLLNAAEDGYQLDKPYLRASGLVSLGSIPVCPFLSHVRDKITMAQTLRDGAKPNCRRLVLQSCPGSSAQFDVCMHRSHLCVRAACNVSNP